jgi:hypothetical protein
MNEAVREQSRGLASVSASALAAIVALAKAR